MLKKEFIEIMKTDQELQQLMQQVYAITGQLKDISFKVGTNQTYEEWKEQLRQIVRENDTTQS